MEAIAQQRRQWLAAVNSQDLERYLDLVTEDIVWIPPGQPALSGRDAFGSWLQPFFEQFHYKFDIIDPEVRPAGSWAVERGGFRTVMTALHGDQGGEHAGRYLVLWRKEPNAIWRIERYLDEAGGAEAAH